MDTSRNRYFAHLDRKLGLRPHCLFNTTVKSAHWNEETHSWDVAAEGNGGLYKANSRYFICANDLREIWRYRMYPKSRGWTSLRGNGRIQRDGQKKVSSSKVNG